MYQNISSTIPTELCGVFFLFLSFLASAFLSMTSFYCPHCRKTIATIVYTHAAEWNSSAKRLLQTHRIKSKPVATKYNETDEKIEEKQSKRLCMAQKSTWSIKSFVRWQWWRPLSLPSSSPSLSIVPIVNELAFALHTNSTWAYNQTLGEDTFFLTNKK